MSAGLDFALQGKEVGELRAMRVRGTWEGVWIGRQSLDIIDSENSREAVAVSCLLPGVLTKSSSGKLRVDKAERNFPARNLQILGFLSPGQGEPAGNLGSTLPGPVPSSVRLASSAEAPSTCSDIF